MPSSSISSMITLLFLGIAVPCFSANIVANPGFETGDLSSWSVSGANSSPGENGIYYGVDTVDAHSGTFGGYFGALGGLMNLTQTLTTAPGAAYTISFWLAQTAAPLPYVNSFSAAFAGATLVAQTALPASNFTQYTFAGTASTATSSLTFSFRNDTGFFSLDDISVDASGSAAAPEPATFLLLSPGLLYLALTRHNRAKNSVINSDNGPITGASIIEISGEQGTRCQPTTPSTDSVGCSSTNRSGNITYCL